MKKIGILGGLAWPATVEYYKAICQLSQDYHAAFEAPGPSPMPEMCIESVNINYSYNRRGRLGDEDSWMEYDAYFHSALQRLEANGVDFAIIASNTPHNRYDAITRDLNIPVLSIFQAVADVCKRQGITQFLLLGTEPTMNAGVCPAFMRAQGIHAFTPEDSRIQARVAALISELFTGKSHEGASRLHQIVDSVYEHTGHSDKTVCLACTELPLAFEGNEQRETFEENGVLYLNTTMIHANATFQYAIKEKVGQYDGN